jgi:hypothetical protein
VSDARKGVAGWAAQLLMLVLRLGQLVVFCHLLFSFSPSQPGWPWSLDLLKHANLLLVGVSVVAPDHIGAARVASDSVNHADPDRPILARLRARATNRTVLWLQSDPITWLQCHRSSKNRLVRHGCVLRYGATPEKTATIPLRSFTGQSPPPHAAEVRLVGRATNRAYGGASCSWAPNYCGSPPPNRRRSPRWAVLQRVHDIAHRAG